jgi:hypothetical protein
MANLAKTEPKSALIEAGQSLLAYQQEKPRSRSTKRRCDRSSFKARKKNKIRSLTLEDGTIFTIKAGNRSVYITDREKAEAYLDNYNCWKLDNAKLLGIFGRELKVPKFFVIERGPGTLATMPPKAKK